MMRRSAIVLVLSLGCDGEPERPTGGLWEPCIPIELECESADHSCYAVGGSDASVCAPGCSLGNACPGAPGGVPVRCNADELVPNSFCIVDCLSSSDCPEAMTCLFDQIQSPMTGKGVCAWTAAD